MDKVAESEDGISEYELTKFLCEEFDINFESEEFYINHFKKFRTSQQNDIPYKDGFDTDDGEFVFLDEFEMKIDDGDGLFLITSKSATSLNSQFKIQNRVYLHPSLGFKNDEMVEISSVYGTLKLKVALDEGIRDDCVLIYSGTDGVNNLTTSKHSYEGISAIYQDEKVKIKKG